MTRVELSLTVCFFLLEQKEKRRKKKSKEEEKKKIKFITKQHINTGVNDLFF